MNEPISLVALQDPNAIMTNQIVSFIICLIWFIENLNVVMLLLKRLNIDQLCNKLKVMFSNELILV